MIYEALEVLLEVTGAIVPVLALILFFQIIVLRKIPPDIKNILFGVGMAIFGFFLFILGAKMSLIVMGEMIGSFLSGVDILWVILFAFVMGIAVIFAEPAVNILAYEIEEVSSGYMRKSIIIPTIAIGVGLALVLGTMRIFYELSLAYILIPGYLLMLLLTLITPEDFVPIAYDSGAVATGPVAVTFALPMMTGMAIGLWGEESGIIGLGTVGIIAMCPIIFMLFLGIIYNRKKKNGQ
ncbi:MAG: DUF1538 domain-containing protein [Methanococcoides sp.]|nr:DUF1538 domain-containing protein [Methanococcoides sp.]MCD4806001.1 DUF1538 domain-containing protein [Methanococcoides sp.]MCD4821775.1 DUF1538 domain-containing protein [Methanococcoides sp.]